ncbi:MAG: response regulator transcription factor [Muribaculaceae bacterium]|nr:response regulator transcription factor [Muribaculaceae bacterium]
MHNKKTILVVDDHPIVLEGIQSILSPLDYTVLKASNAATAIEIARERKDICVYVIDYSLRDSVDGLRLVAELRDMGLYHPTIIYTMHEELWNISAILQANVEGIVLKGEDITELTRAIEVVASGGRYQSPAVDERREAATQTARLLSAKDVDVLRLLAAGLTNRDIAAEMKLSEKSIEYHRSNILRKLNAKTMLEATKKAIQLGIID